jgi:hypothetical protein
LAALRRGRYSPASAVGTEVGEGFTRSSETSRTRNVSLRVKTLALVAWVPVVVGAILATYGNTAWNDVGVATWMVGLAIQFGSFVFWLRPERGRF